MVSSGTSRERVRGRTRACSRVGGQLRPAAPAPTARPQPGRSFRRWSRPAATDATRAVSSGKPINKFEKQVPELSSLGLIMLIAILDDLFAGPLGSSVAVVKLRDP